MSHGPEPFTAPTAVYRLVSDILLPSSSKLYHISLLSDIYLLPCPRSPCPHPSSWHALRSSTRTRLELTRLPDGSTVSDLDAAVSVYSNASIRPGFALRVTGITRLSRAALKHRESDTRILVAPTERERDEWLAALRLQLAPASLLLREVAAAFDGTPGAGSGIAGDARRALERAREAEAVVGGGFDGSDAGAFAQCAFGLAGAGAGFGFVTTCLQGLHDVVRPDGVDGITRAFGGVALVGPLILVAGLVVKGVSMLAEAEAELPNLVGMQRRLEVIGNKLFIIAYGILQTGLRAENFRRTELVEDVFAAVVTCAGLFADVERHILHKRVWRAWNAEEVARLGRRFAELEVQLKFSRHAHLAASHENRFQGLESEVAGVRDQLSSMNVGDVFHAVWHNVPEVPDNVVVTGLPQLEPLLQNLLNGGGAPGISGQRADLAAIASGCGPSVRSVAAHGWGGVGKTTACVIAARDERVRQTFPGGGLFLKFGEYATDKDVTGQLRDFAFVTGGKDVANAIDKIEPGRMQVSRVVALVAEWMKGRDALFMADNIFRRSQGVPWVRELLKLVECSGSAFLFSTRHAELARITPSEQRFEFHRVQDPAVARGIFCAHAGLGPSEPAVNEEQRLTVDFILSICDGWHLALKVAGKGAQLLCYDWQKLKDAIDDALLLEFDDDVDGLEGVGIVMSANLKLLSGLPRSRLLLLGAPRSSCGNSNFFENAFRRLVVLARVKTVPLSLLPPVFGVSEPEAEALARLLHDAGLATLESGECKKPDGGAVSGASGQMLSLHDLQLQFASDLCECESRGVASVAAQHWQFLNEYCLLYGDGNSRVTRFDWWRFFEEGATFCQIYIRSNLFVHLNAASAHCPEDVLTTEFVLLSSFLWLRGRWCAGGRRAVVGDCNLMLSTMSASNMSNDQRQTIVSLRRTLMDVEDTVSFLGSGALASALVQQAGCLCENEVGGVFSVREFAKTLAESASADVRGGWLRSVSGCVRDEWRDTRVIEKVKVGKGGAVWCVAPLGDGCHAVSAGEDGYLRVHEGVELDVVLEWEGHGGKPILFFAIQRTTSCPCSFSIFSSGTDEFVRAWEVHVDEARVPSVVEDGLVGECGDRVRHIAVSEDRRLVVAGCHNGRVLIWKKRDGETSFAFDLVKTFFCEARESSSGPNKVRLAMSGCGGMVVAGVDSGGLTFWTNGEGEGELNVAIVNAMDGEEEEIGDLASILLSESGSFATVFFSDPGGYEVWDLRSKSRCRARERIEDSRYIWTSAADFSIEAEDGLVRGEASFPTRYLLGGGLRPFLILEFGLLTAGSQSLSELTRFEIGSLPVSVCYASFGGRKRAITGCFDGLMLLLDLEVSERQESTSGVQRDPLGELSEDGACQADVDVTGEAFGSVLAVAVMPKCGLVLAAHQDGTISVWCGKSGEYVQKCENDTWCTLCLDVSENEEAMVSGHGSGLVLVWTSGDWQTRLALRGSDDMILSVTFSPDGRRVAAVDETGDVFLWDANVDANSFNSRFRSYFGSQVTQTRYPLVSFSTAISYSDLRFMRCRSGVSRNGNYFVWATLSLFCDWKLKCIDLRDGAVSDLMEEAEIDGDDSFRGIFERLEREGFDSGGGWRIGGSYLGFCEVLLAVGAESVLVVRHAGKQVAERLQCFIRAADGSKLGDTQLHFGCSARSLAAGWMPQDGEGCRRVLVACGLEDKSRPAIVQYIPPTSQLCIE